LHLYRYSELGASCDQDQNSDPRPERRAISMFCCDIAYFRQPDGFKGRLGKIPLVRAAQLVAPRTPSGAQPARHIHQNRTERKHRPVPVGGWSDWTRGRGKPGGTRAAVRGRCHLQQRVGACPTSARAQYSTPSDRNPRGPPAVGRGRRPRSAIRPPDPGVVASHCGGDQPRLSARPRALRHSMECRLQLRDHSTRCCNRRCIVGTPLSSRRAVMHSVPRP
jgi:hypothetical protein